MPENCSEKSQNGTCTVPAVNGNAVTASPRRCAPKLNTQERLFGQVAPAPPPKKISNTFRSKIFDNSVPGSPPRTPKKTLSVLERNPITGEERPPKKINM
ncbi:hypothetical protein Ddc_00650 [Ditylenchus destructor]|nr:hypothetical protein Ddc_00650 [Ditylenchus destructor]